MHMHACRQRRQKVRGLNPATRTCPAPVGSLQTIFLYQSSEGAAGGDQLGQITLPQFRGVMQAAKVITSRFPPEKVDEIFTGVATSEQTLARWGQLFCYGYVVAIDHQF